MGLLDGRVFGVPLEDLPRDSRSSDLPAFLVQMLEILANNQKDYTTEKEIDHKTIPEIARLLSDDPNKQLTALQQLLATPASPELVWSLLWCFFELLPGPFIDPLMLVAIHRVSLIKAVPLQFECFQSLYFRMPVARRVLFRSLVESLNFPTAFSLFLQIFETSRAAMASHAGVKEAAKTMAIPALEEEQLRRTLQRMLNCVRAKPDVFFGIAGPGIRYELTSGDRRLAAIHRDYLFLKVLDAEYVEADSTFLPTILFMHSYFTTSEMLLEKLIEAFDHPDTTVDTKQHIINVLRRWVTRYYEELSSQIVWIERLSMFMYRLPDDPTLLGSQKSPTHGHIKAIQQCLKAHALVQTDLRLANHPRTFVVGTECPPEEVLNISEMKRTMTPIATQITLLDFDFMSRIVPTELLHRHFQDEELSPNWHRWVSFSNKLRLWSIEHVVRHQQDQKACIKALKRIQSLALELHKLQDFNGCFAVLLALTRLSDLAARLMPHPDDRSSRVSVLLKLYAMEKNFSALRTLISSCTLPCVPVAYLLSRDICIIEEAFQSTENDPESKQDLIAVYKLRNLNQTISKFSDFQNSEYPAQAYPRRNEILTYFFLTEVPAEEHLDALLANLVKRRKL